MNKKLRSILQYVIFLGGGIALVWWQLHGMTDEQEKQFKHALRHANYILIIPVVIMNLASHLSRSMRWKLLMEPLDYRPKLKNVFAVTMIGYLANAAIPRLGEVLKCTFLSRYEHIKADKLIGTILIERTFDLICYFIFIGITVLIQLDAVGGYTAEKFRQIGENGVSVWLIVIVALIILSIIITRILFKKHPENRNIVAVKNFFSGIGVGFNAIRNLRHRKLFLLHTLFIWMMYLLQIYLAFKAMNATSHLGLKAACSVLTLSTLAMIITPNGIGTFPVLVMETLLIYGITATQGKALGWLIWGVSTGIIIIAGLLSLVLLPYINKKKHEVATGNSGQDLHDGEAPAAD